MDVVEIRRPKAEIRSGCRVFGDGPWKNYQTTGRWKSEKTAGYEAVAAAEDGHAPDFENTGKSGYVYKN
jgi:hypothetical protein